MYLVDTNILLNAFNYYPRSVFPSYWKVFEARLSSGEFCVHEQVYEELKKKDDDKIRWLEANRAQRSSANKGFCRVRFVR